MNDLLRLPLAVQVALGCGYLAYLIASAGVRQHHTATDTIFRTIAFGLIATAIIAWAPLPQWARIWIAAGATILTGAFWRWRGAKWARAILRASGVSWSDDIPTAWLSITALDTDICPSQIAVDLADGRLLLCDDTRRFGDAPHGPCSFGLDGGIAFYVTAEMRSDGTWIEKTDVRDPIDGDMLTYIPASSIKRVEIRLWTKANAKAVLVGARETVAAEGAAAS